MKVLTTAEMKALDNYTIKELGISGQVLMENAGRAVVKVLKQDFSPALERGCLIICGPGNNGGDGLVVARYLLDEGFPFKVYLLVKEDKLSGDAALNLKSFQKLGGKVLPLSAKNLKIFKADLNSCGIVVDALFGTGLTKALSGISKELINLINQSGLKVVSVDIPSGVEGNSGKFSPIAVRADATVTMGALKAGLLLYPGAEFCGKIYLARIGIPEKLIEKFDCELELIKADEFLAELPPRPAWAHKGSCGKVLLLAGSPGYSGAAALAAEAALRSGAGLVYLGIPESLNPILEVKCTEAVTLPLPETKAGLLSFGALKPILKLAEQVEVLAVGPGMGRGAEQKSLLTELLNRVKIPVVVDADGLNNLAGTKPQKNLPLVLTPHPGEMANLLGIKIEQLLADPLKWLKKLSADYRAVVVLKGAHSLIAEPGGKIKINPSGNSGMASAGMGDVLTGAIAGLIAQGLEIFPAAWAGVFLHGFAGDLAAEELGSRGILAGDLLPRLPQSLEMIAEGMKFYSEPEIIF